MRKLLIFAILGLSFGAKAQDIDLFYINHDHTYYYQRSVDNSSSDGTTRARSTTRAFYDNGRSFISLSHDNLTQIPNQNQVRIRIGGVKVSHTKTSQFGGIQNLCDSNCGVLSNISESDYTPTDVINYGTTNPNNLNTASIAAYGKVLILPRVPQPAAPITRDDELFIQNSVPIQGGFWTYEIDGAEPKRLEDNRFPLNITLEEFDNLIPENLENSNSLLLRFYVLAEGGGSFNRVIMSSTQNNPGSAQLERENYQINNYFFDIIKSSPTLVNTDASNASCFGVSDGEVILTFEENVEDDYEMRYFIFQGEPSDFTGDTTTKEKDDFPNQVFDEVRFSPPGPNNPSGLGALNDNGDGTFSGTYSKLDGINSNPNPPSEQENQQNYYIIYQEVKYDGLDVEVKSGEILDESFTIRQPNPISASATITQASCSQDSAQINFSASGGNNLDNSGSYNFQYQLNNDGNWQTASGNPQSIPTTTNNQTVQIKAIYSVENCESAEILLSETINAQVPPLEFNDPSPGMASSNTNTDGVISIEYEGGTPGYSFELTTLNNSTSNYDEVSNPTIFDFPLDGRVEFQDLGVGTYRIIITDSNSCELTSQDILVSTTPPPNIDSVDVTQIDCLGDSDGAINATVSGGVTPYNYQWTENGTVSPTQSTGTSVISLSNLEEAGEYILKIASNGFTDFNDASGYSTTTITFDSPEEVIINATNATNISCNGAQNGNITVDVSGGTSFEYKLDFFDTWKTLNANTIPIVSGGSYDLYIRNQSGCEANSIPNILVEEPDELIVSENLPNHQNATTNNGTDGSIEVDVTGGTPFTDQTPDYYNYEWTGPNGTIANNSNILSNIGAGTYQVTVTDVNDCQITSEEIIVTQPGPLAILTFSGTDVCNGSSNGTLTATTEGTGEITYNWILEDGSPNGSTVATSTTTERTVTAEGLSPGVYSLTIVEVDSGNEANSTESVTIGEATAISATTTATEVGCNEVNTGTITVTETTGGTPFQTGSDYEYRIDDAFNTFQTEATFSGLAPRTYTVTIRDANGCEFTNTIEVAQATPPVLDETNTSITDATTSDGNDGSISLAFSSDATDYSYVWTGPNVDGSTSKDLTGLAAGSYQVTVSADANCTLVEDFTINEPGPLSITDIQTTDVLCNGETNGSIMTTVNGTGTITYIWNKIGEGEIAGANGPDLNDIGPGTYTLTVDDETATPAVTSIEITIDEPTILTAEAFATDVRCASGADGSVTLTPTGGTVNGGYSFSIDGGNSFQTQNSFNGLTAGNYVIIVQDDNGCPIDIPVTIAQPLPIGLNIDLQQSLSAANASDGAISITAFGGTGNLSFSWSADNGFTSTDEDIVNLSGGTYTLTIRDENWNSAADTGCAYTQDFLIAEPGELVVDITQDILLECNGDDFAEISANVQGGVTPYIYEWFEITNGNEDELAEDTEILANLSAGEYFVRVTDDNGISLDATPITVSEPDGLEITVDNITDVLCSDDPTGAITVSVSGGNAPYSYFWSDGTTAQNLVDVEAGQYTLEVVDANGCLALTTATIDPAPNAVQIADATLTDISEYLANDGSISVDITGGAAPYTIDWIRISDNVNVGNEETISGLSADMYQISITDANGCSVAETYEINQPDIVEDTIVQPTCEGDSDGSISVIVNQGNGNFSYNWNTGATTNTIDNLQAGSYTVTITGFGDGPLTRTYELENPQPLEIDLGEDRILCAGQELILDATVDDDTAIYTWTSDNGFSSNEPTVTLTQTGNYTATISTASGCTTARSIFVDISTDEIDAEFAASTQVFVGETVVAVDISFPLPDTIEWVLPEEAKIVKQDGDEVELRFEEAGEYDIGILTTRGECVAQQTKKIIVVAPDGTVEDKDTENGRKLIEDFLVFPNPSDGKFTAEVNLTERGNISIKVFSLANNAMMASEKDRGELSYSIPFDLSGLPVGVYAVLLETPFGSTLRKVILK